MLARWTQRPPDCDFALGGRCTATANSGQSRTPFPLPSATDRAGPAPRYDLALDSLDRWEEDGAIWFAILRSFTEGFFQ